jgi:LPXTG-motif cell wall-anchored protein
VAALPRTGRDVTALVLLALGLVLVGSAAVDAAARRR